MWISISGSSPKSSIYSDWLGKTLKIPSAKEQDADFSITVVYEASKEYGLSLAFGSELTFNGKLFLQKP